MKEAGAVRSAIDIRERVDALVPAMMTYVELTADQVRAASSDVDVRRRALRFKIDLVPVIYEAGFRADPLAAGLDLWLLSYQLEDCLDAGDGPCDFGSEQPAARGAAQQQRQALDRMFQEASLNRQAQEWERQLVRDAARRHPLHDQSSLRYRSTITIELANVLKIEPLSPIDLLGTVTMTVTTLSGRLNLYVDEAARLARWQAELLAEDAGWPSIDRALGDVGRMTASVERLSNTLDPELLNTVVDRAVAAAHEERKAMMADIDHERELTLEQVSEERKALVDTFVARLMAGVDDERVTALADLRKERLETLADIERLRSQLITDGFAEGRRLVDHAAWRLAQLMCGGLFFATLLVWTVMRYRHTNTAGR